MIQPDWTDPTVAHQVGPQVWSYPDHGLSEPYIALVLACVFLLALIVWLQVRSPKLRREA